MKVPMQWIRQYTDIPVTPEEFESAMIMHGTGVEGLENQIMRHLIELLTHALKV